MGTAGFVAYLGTRDIQVPVSRVTLDSAVILLLIRDIADIPAIVVIVGCLGIQGFVGFLVTVGSVA